MKEKQVEGETEGGAVGAEGRDRKDMNYRTRSKRGCETSKKEEGEA